MDEHEAIEFLCRDSGAVPCSRYGSDSEDCAPVAYAFAAILARETYSDLDEELIDYAMGLVVNDHDDVEALIREYGTTEQIELLDT